jgi:enhanced filamentous growth protein 1
MQQYSTAQGYDSNRSMYSGPPSQPGQYSSQNPGMPRYDQSSQGGIYSKSEMAPPSSALTNGVPSTDSKPPDGYAGGADHSRVLGEVEEPENANEYTHSSAPYNASRGSYSSYPSGAVQSEHPHLSPEMTSSPHQNGSGRATPRTAAAGPAQWGSGYSTPQRAPQPPSTNLMHVMSNDSRNAPNGAAPADSYAYPSSYAATNGTTSNKRGRDMDDDEQDYGRPASHDDGGLKRRKTIREDSVGGGVAAAGYDNRDQAGLQRTNSVMSRGRR